VTALSVMRLLPKPTGIIESGRIFFNGADLTQLSADKMHEIRGKRISMIFQEPMTSLNPVHKIGKQLCEVFGLHFSDLSGDEIRQQSLELLQKVGIKKWVFPNPNNEWRSIRTKFPVACGSG
jgi:ABC-type microcin C transport system duplicated ATPase subunit YejF